MKFDPNEFERLGGLEASDYAVQLTQRGITEGDVMPYLKEKIATMDVAHLEVAVFLLGNIRTNAAWQMVAEYLDHPDFNIRFMASKMIRTLNSADATIMNKVVTSLSKFAGDGMTDELKVLLDRPANEEAQRIAELYRSK